MGVKVITPPAQLIPTADLRAQCRVTAATEDAQLIAFLDAAREYCEHYTGRALGSQTLELALDVFPDGPIELPRGKVTAISTITYVDPAQAVQTLSSSLYTLDDYGIQDWAVPAVNTSWPDTGDVANAVKVRYVSGTLPGAGRAALLLMVGHLYENREASAPVQLEELPLGIKSLLDTFRMWSF